MEGKLEGKVEVVKNMILKLVFSDEHAAEVAGVSIEFVQKIRAGVDE